MTIRSNVLNELTTIAGQQGKKLRPLTDDLPIMDSGVDSLCLAILVATLEEKLGLDPFDGDGPAEFPVTIGQLVELYEHAAV